ncbi:unnamed protein product [Timema podura]|uniref:Uncharacterized protein n=1 Tax=Timema podura TaxID=61482 RepID=A0ABN7P1D1_TIMPD|nr:unnamed protein product [Timema podura]
MSSKPDVIEEMHLKFQFQDGVILNEIVQAFNYEEQEDIDYLLLLEKLSKEQHFVMQFKECKSLDPRVRKEASQRYSTHSYHPPLNPNHLTLSRACNEDGEGENTKENDRKGGQESAPEEKNG